MRLLPCCRQPPYGIWPASFNTPPPVERKNNSMSKCFAVFLRVREFVPPMSRRRVANRRELLLPVLMPDRYQTGVVFGPAPSGPLAVINGEAGEAPEAWTRRTTYCRSAKQTNQTREAATAEGATAELIVGNDLFARLIFQRIRPRTHSGMISEQSCSPHEPPRTRASIPSPDITTSLVNCAKVSVSAPIPPEIETLFTQLARRRLRSRATEETR